MRAFAVVLLVLVLAGILAMRSGPADSAGPFRPTAAMVAVLSDAEALATVERLNEIRHRAFRERDLSALSSLYTTDSPARRRAVREIQQLLDDRVLQRSTYVTFGLEVLSRSASEIEVRETVRIHPRFITESGTDITTQRRPVEQSVIWTLRPERGAWLVYELLITRSKIVGRGRS